MEKTVYNQYFFTDFYAKNGGGNYTDRQLWLPNFRYIADRIIELFNPRTVLDAGCALGYLVEALREKGVDAYGFDISEYAINNVDPKIRDYCFVHSITDPLPERPGMPRHFDLVVTIEVMEHLYPEMALAAIANLCSLSGRILFTSTPSDIEDPTHVNVQLQEKWVRLFALQGFYRELVQPVDFIAPWGMVFRNDVRVPDIIQSYEMNHRLLKDRCTALEARNKKLIALFRSKKEDFQLKESYEYLKEEFARLTEQSDELRALLADRQQSGALLEQQNAELRRELEQFRSSTVWQMTRPIRRSGDAVKKLLSWAPITPLLRRAFGYLKRNGLKRTLRRVLKGRPLPPIDPDNSQPAYTDTNRADNNNSRHLPESVEQVIGKRFRYTQPIQTVHIRSDRQRLNLVTDSIEPHSLLGGVATALIIATELANRFGFPLRIITRTTATHPANYFNILKMSGIAAPAEVSFFSDHDRDEHGDKAFKLELSAGDIFMATSWWSAEAIRRTALNRKMLYVIQEVETYFYPHGDEHYFCSRIMEDPDILYLVNSHYLMNYFEDSQPNIFAHGHGFEPAFPESIYRAGSIVPKHKYKIFFYARPNNPRNMFYHGISIINACIRQGIIDLSEWDIYCAGQNLPQIVFENGYKPISLGLLSWSKYAEFLREVDLTISLMYTPHPSYPPYDAACSGSVVVTNKYLNKTQMDECRNIIMSDLDEPSLVQSVAQGIELAKNIPERLRNYQDSTIARSWNQNIESLIERVGEYIGHAAH